MKPSESGSSTDRIMEGETSSRAANPLRKSGIESTAESIPWHPRQNVRLAIASLRAMKAKLMYDRLLYIILRILSMDTLLEDPNVAEAIRKLPAILIPGIRGYQKLFRSPKSTIESLETSDARCEISENLLGIFKGGSRSVENWLQEGPVVKSLMSATDVHWESFKSQVDKYLLDPASRPLLDFDIHVLFFGAEASVAGALNATINQAVEDVSGSLNLDDATTTDPRQLEEGRRASDEDTGRVIHTNTNTQSQRRWSAFENTVRNSWKEARRPLGVLLYIINIGAGLGYVMLTNPFSPGPNKGPKPVAVADEVASRVQLVFALWLITTVVLLTDGLFFSIYTTQSYASRLLILSLIICGCIGSALHMIGGNAMSGVLIGVSLAMAFLQIW
ncbi:hypothetical protein GLAREA_08715 [Glarea lozoyensis ATCC 20868]|uniref:Uncharacterized protein n=1 Tax=Glarea lozoyensis (strain ATCC 20868 / MF5171) TaxID=1116229 RepID=S3DDN9_GLAL2|nr:uncharacterized protein GLAREA_08715 [Glarea lozoyensis ATCC 20868]EPE36552.1 hypothetical protein GLAREA_08715 [Glarea lozoyensis ATCC 20868]